MSDLLKRLSDGEGFFFLDERASGGKLDEQALYGCGHCPKFVKKKEWEDQGGYRCYGCHKPLCEECRKRPPQMKCIGTDADQIEKQLSDMHRREQNAKILGI
jgi:hypothetical protein